MQVLSVFAGISGSGAEAGDSSKAQPRRSIEACTPLRKKILRNLRF